MTDSPPASRLEPPSWLDLRLVLGVLLVLVAVVVGARVLATADDTTRVWGLTRDLAPGSAIAAGDLEPVRVRLLDADDAYVSADGAAPTGYLVTRGLGGGELLPRAALRDPQEQSEDLRDVSVPVDRGHLPSDLGSGELVDVYVTREEAASPTDLVLRDVPVLRRSGDDRGADAEAVVLSVPVADVGRLVEALRAGTVDLVRVARGADLERLPSPGAP